MISGRLLLSPFSQASRLGECLRACCCLPARSAAPAAPAPLPRLADTHWLPAMVRSLDTHLTLILEPVTALFLMGEEGGVLRLPPSGINNQ